MPMKGLVAEAAAHVRYERAQLREALRTALDYLKARADRIRVYREAKEATMEDLAELEELERIIDGDS